MKAVRDGARKAEIAQLHNPLFASMCATNQRLLGSAARITIKLTDEVTNKFSDLMSR